jgi:chromosomal replication initiator protein
LESSYAVTPQEIWNTAKTQLQLQMDRGNYETWVKNAEFIKFVEDENAFVIGVHNEMARSHLETRLYRNVHQMLCNISCKMVEVRFQIMKSVPVVEFNQEEDMPLFRYVNPPAPENNFFQHTEDSSVAELLRQPRHTDLPENELNTKLVFGRFVINKSNEMAYQAAQAIIDYPGTNYNPFFVYGNSGVGKTHLLQAIGHEYQKRNLRVLYISSEVFTTEFITAIRNRTQAMFQQKYRTVDVLLMDDVHFLNGKDSTQEEFFHTYNALTHFNKQIVLVSDRHPRDMHGVDNRLLSRFQSGLVLDIQPPEYETRRLILDMWATEKEVALDSKILDNLANRSASSVRELEGYFAKLMAEVRFKGTRVTNEQIENVLNRHAFSSRERFSPTIIIEKTAQKFGLATHDLTGKKRTEQINEARQVAMYLVRELTEFSLPQIGTVFGGRSHTTVLHGINKVIEDMQKNPQFKATVDRLKKSF